jgi:mRNA interferase RelE/StbE
MPHRIEITRRAERQLKGLPAQTQERIAEGISLLGQNPDSSKLDVKKLTNDPEAHYRLRIGSYRVKFNRDDKIEIIAIIRIAHRKDAYR